MASVAALICFSASFGFAEQAAPPERTLLFLTPSGALQMANVSAKGTRIPQAQFAPGKKVRRFLLSPKGDVALLETSDAGGTTAAWSLDLATRRLKRLGTGLLLPAGKNTPFSPDGRRLALRRQSSDEIAVLSAATGQVLQTVAAPGIQDAPAWFGDGRHLAAPTRLPSGKSTLSILDGTTGKLRRDVFSDETPVRYRFEEAAGGRLVYCETREGVDRWLAVPLEGEPEVVDQPLEPDLPADLPLEAEGAAIEGPWLAYVREKRLYLRYAEEGAQPVEQTAATAFLWKPGAAIPERLLLPPVTPPVTPGATPPAVVPGVLSLRASSKDTVEGQPLGILWEPGARVAWVRLSAVVERTPIGGRKRGSDVLSIGRANAALRTCAWVVPWLDGVRFSLRAEAIDASGRVLGRAGLPLTFRPKGLAGETRDGIFVHLSDARHQRLYVQEDGQLQAYVCSGAEGNKRLSNGLHPDAPHDHYGTFSIRVKDIDHVSNIDPEWKMPFAMGYLQGHYIHKTARNQYRKLGRPASHGCVRLHGVDAEYLFGRIPVGEMVVIY